MTDSIDYKELNKLLDKTITAAFVGKNAAFLGSLSCSTQVEWDPSIPTACTDGVKIWWNPTWFESLPRIQREVVYVHELWHPARLHFHRGQGKDWSIWAQACDYVINQEMKDDGYDFGEVPHLYRADFYGKSEEEIYDILLEEQKQQKTKQKSSELSAGGGTSELDDTGSKDNMNDITDGADLVRPSASALRENLNNVVQAVQQAVVFSGVGSVPGGLREMIDSYLKSVVPWHQLLDRFLTDLDEEDFSWQRPNRRHHDIYLPVRIKEESRLTRVNYYLDVSGSIDQHQLLRFNSEARHIKEKFNPEMMKLIQFDWIIQHVTEISEFEKLKELEVIGRGGTCLECVREHIKEDKPTAVIIFTDLGCEPMQPLPPGIDVIWVVVNNPNATVPFGQMIHVKT